MSSSNYDSDTNRGFEGETAEYDASFLGQFKLERKSAILQILRGNDTGMRVPLTQDVVTIGRTIDADLCLHDSKISRVHAKIQRHGQGDEYSITDLKSTNGTFVNNQPILGTVDIVDGDKIFVGHTILKFSLEDEVESASGEMVDRYLFQDDLTGLVVKRRFYNELRVSLQMAVNREMPLAVLMMDMDGLKGVNDAFGHSMGAYVISEAGKRIGEICNPLGQACRYGGDEFVAYVKDCDTSGGLEIANQICESIREKPFVQDGHELDLSISIGVASFPTNGRDVDILNRAADEALYRAKDKGRNLASE